MKTLLFLLALALAALGISALWMRDYWWRLFDRLNRRLGRSFKRVWQWEIQQVAGGIFFLILAGLIAWVAWQL